MIVMLATSALGITLLGFLTSPATYVITANPLYAYNAPIIAAVMFLGLAFDYLPHRPHNDATNPLRATSLVTLWQPAQRNATPQQVAASGIRFLTWPLLHQNFHLVHHIFPPTVPFYLYERLYWDVADKLHEAGARVFPLFPIVILPGDV